MLITTFITLLSPPRSLVPRKFVSKATPARQLSMASRWAPCVMCDTRFLIDSMPLIYYYLDKYLSYLLSDWISGRRHHDVFVYICYKMIGI